MLRIRLRRMGRRNQPFFQIVVIERGAPPKGGRAKEMLGSIDPLTKERIIKKERVEYWLSAGAQPSDTVHNMLVSAGIIKGKKKPVHAKSKKKTEEKVGPEPKVEKEPAEVSKEQPEEKIEEKTAKAKPAEKPVKKEKPAAKEEKKE